MSKIVDLKTLIEYHQEIIDMANYQRNHALKDLSMRGVDESDRLYLLNKAERASAHVDRHRTALDIIVGLMDEIESLKEFRITQTQLANGIITRH